MQDILGKNWEFNLSDERMLIAWNSGSLPLHTGVLPPFMYGKGIHNQWVVSESALSDFRLVFDASWSISNFYMNDVQYLSNQSIGGSAKSITENRSWEYACNAQLGAHYGLSYFRESNLSNLVKLLKCNGRYVFVNATEGTLYPVRYQSSLSLWKEKILFSCREGNDMVCVNSIKTLHKPVYSSLKDEVKPSKQLDFPFSLQSLLSIVADKNRTVVLTVAGDSYKEMLMSWVCRLHQLQIRNFLVSSLDSETYQFSVSQVYSALQTCYSVSSFRLTSFI